MGFQRRRLGLIRIQIVPRRSGAAGGIHDHGEICVVRYCWSVDCQPEHGHGRSHDAGFQLSMFEGLTVYSILFPDFVGSTFLDQYVTFLVL